MTFRMPVGAIFALVALTATNPGFTHSGGLDGNGCHYENGRKNYHCHRTVSPNPDRNSPVKKSRENVCHTKASPNWSSIRYFIAYRTIEECLASGGRPFGS